MKRYLILLFISTAFLFGEEGMWPLNMVPKKHLETTYGITLSDQWLDHIQHSCLRLSHGGSASIISPSGLVMTNHHVGAKSIYNLSTEKENFLEKGFYAKSYQEELKCPNLYADQLISIVDVTGRVNKNLIGEKTPAEREKKRKAAIAQIIEKAQHDTGLQPEMVTLYRGGRYHLYLYKRYTDLRLVMCPEKGIASFGGAIENFEFPRHCLDVCFLRIYENDKPLKSKRYVKLNPKGPQENELLFVLGHPGSTSRILTTSHLRHVQEMTIPLLLTTVSEKMTCLKAFGKKSEEHWRMASQLLSSYENAYKVYHSSHVGLKRSSLIQDKMRDEDRLLRTLSSTESKPWRLLDEALKEVKPFYRNYLTLEAMATRHVSTLFSFARHLIRACEERLKPNEERLKEYRESNLPALELKLFSEEPFYPELESALLDDSLKRMVKCLGPDHPLFETLRTKKAEQMVKESQLGKLDYRQLLYNHPEELQKSSDPFILLARAIDPFAREVRARYEDEFLAPQKENYNQIAKIAFDRHGESIYPDATFTLRLSIGKMEGYQEGTTWLTPTTTLSGLFTKASSHQKNPDFTLPATWTEKKDQLTPSTPFNFVSTHDITGGNSGSPVINVKGEVVGLVFDGNRHSFLWDYAFDQTVGRAIHVHPAIIIESLQKVYQAYPLVKEMLGR